MPSLPHGSRLTTFLSLSPLLSSPLSLSPSLARQILKAIDLAFLRHLHQERHLAPLLFLTADRSLNIRNLAIELLGKVADRNPALVLPHLRQVLKKVICDLQNGATSRIREGACKGDTFLPAAAVSVQF
jgi:hypothetical protein